jgi:SPP1 gp7 family putative phage head morphogenesis protein
MNRIPTIKGSAQARLLLYRLLSVKLHDAERKILDTNPALWEQFLLHLEEFVVSDAQTKSDAVILVQAFAHIDRSTRDGLQKQIARLTGQSLWLGVHSTSLLDEFVKEHLTLIKSVQRQHLEKIGLTLRRGIREGRLQKDIAKEIRNQTLIEKRRAQLIARNAPLQYSGALTKHHQTSAGIKSYIWQSSRDERVRDSHRKLDGEIFSWEGLGPHPRCEVNCRCDAIPILSSEMDYA